MKRARTENGPKACATPVYSVERNGRTRKVTVPEDPAPEDILLDALRENLDPRTMAAIAAYLQPVRTMDPRLIGQIRWFAELLTDAVGGQDEIDRLCEEAGL